MDPSNERPSRAVDADRSAQEIRDRIAADLGVAVGIIVSDSFGRPWRWGIVDIALGVAGFSPLDDQRGRPDTAGRVMKATVVAVADQIASAAELASGKTSGLPLVLVRGAQLPPGDATITGSALMPPSADMFKQDGSRPARDVVAQRRCQSTALRRCRHPSSARPSPQPCREPVISSTAPPADTGSLVESTLPAAPGERGPARPGASPSPHRSGDRGQQHDHGWLADHPGGPQRAGPTVPLTDGTAPRPARARPAPP